jgi:hypothetical protein
MTTPITVSPATAEHYTWVTGPTLGTCLLDLTFR